MLPEELLRVNSQLPAATLLALPIAEQTLHVGNIMQRVISEGLCRLGAACITQPALMRFGAQKCRSQTSQQCHDLANPEAGSVTPRRAVLPARLIRAGRARCFPLPFRREPCITAGVVVRLHMRSLIILLEVADG